MKFISRTILTTAAVLLASTTFAKTEITCPSIQTLKSLSTFSEIVVNAKPGYAFLSHSYSYENRNWLTFFGGLFDESIQTNEEAIAAGNKMFQELPLSEPRIETEGDEAALCIYQEGSESTPFFAMAVTPAEILTPGMTNRVKKFMKS